MAANRWVACSDSISKHQLHPCAHPRTHRVTSGVALLSLCAACVCRPPARDQQAGGGQIGASGAERDVCDDSFSPFASAAASQPGGPAHADQSPLPLDDDAAAAIAAAESGDDVAPLPDTTPGPAGSQPQGGKGAGGGAKAFVAGGGMDGKSGGNKRFRQQSKRKLIPLKQVTTHTVAAVQAVAEPALAAIGQDSGLGVG